MTNYWNNGVAVAFTRDGRCFFAMAQFGSLSRSLQTGMCANILEKIFSGEKSVEWSYMAIGQKDR